jgi:hypothetical protein
MRPEARRQVAMPTPHRTPPSEEALLEEAERWRRRALACLLVTWRRRGAAHARRLERAHRLRDPATDVLTLAARRCLPLPWPIRRLLPRAVSDVGVRAFGALCSADRAALWRRADAGPQEAQARAAALLRLALNAQAVRRETGAPPGDS